MSLLSFLRRQRRWNCAPDFHMLACASHHPCLSIHFGRHCPSPFNVFPSLRFCLALTMLLRMIQAMFMARDSADQSIGLHPCFSSHVWAMLYFHVGCVSEHLRYCPVQSTLLRMIQAMLTGHGSVDQSIDVHDRQDHLRLSPHVWAMFFFCFELYVLACTVSLQCRRCC